MVRFLAFRIGQSLITLAAVAVAIFTLARLSGDPLSLMLPISADEAQFKAVQESLGLDKPVPVQFALFLSHAVVGDFGTSIKGNRPVSQMIAERLPRSLLLALLAIAITVVFGVPLGVLAAVHKEGPIDVAARIVAFLGQSMPSFFLAIILIRIFAIDLRLLPVIGSDTPQSYILPAITLGWFIMAGVVRLLRSSMLEVLDSEYVKLARLKGVAEPVVIWKHALRNALLPVITFLGFMLGTIVAAAVVVETVFAWPGIGSLAYEAVLARDYPLMQGVIVIWAALIIVINLAVDMAYAYLDPRIRY